MADPSRPRAQRTSAAVPSNADEDVERAMALRDVMEHVVDTAQTPPPAKKSRKRTTFVIVLCVLLLGASAYSWFARPETIWGPSGEPVSPIVDRASARMSMIMIAQRLDEARAKTGQYPLTLEEIGEPASGISYTLLGDSGFVLTAATVMDTVQYRSGQPLEEFLGRSVELLTRARR